MIDILMATYNGEAYIKEQIDSILNQTYKEWKLYIRDDGSTDNTVKIIKEYVLKYNDRIILIEDGMSGLGAKANFLELMKYSTNDYCMFSDQDDVWLENKIDISLNRMKETEEKYGNNTPILVNTDLKVVDENKFIINESYWDYQQLCGQETRLNKIIVENNVTGCTMLLNRSLLKKSLDMPKEAIMHDYWINLIAVAFGKREIISEPTILYRQHSNNEVGASNTKSINYLISKLNKNDIDKSICKSIGQANKFYSLYGYDLNDSDKEYLEKFINIKNSNLLKRKIIAIKNGFFKYSTKRKIGYILFI